MNIYQHFYVATYNQICTVNHTEQYYSDFFKFFLSVFGGGMAEQSYSHNKEIDKYYTFNQTGNVLVSSTVQKEQEIKPLVIKEFQKLLVLFDAITVALSKHNKHLYDYDALHTILSKCGFLAQVHDETRIFDRQSSSLSIDQALILDIIGGVSPLGPAMQIAQKVVSSIGGKAKHMTASSSRTTQSDKLGHLIFVCENLLGTPLMTVQLVSAKLDEINKVTEIGCAKVANQSVHMEYTVQEFVFVDPEIINRFAPEFKQSDEFGDFVDNLAKLLEPAAAPRQSPGT